MTGTCMAWELPLSGSWSSEGQWGEKLEEREEEGSLPDCWR